ncbi:hypothetical protein [Nonomuraea sp. NPDC046570]
MEQACEAAAGLRALAGASQALDGPELAARLAAVLDAERGN